MVVRVEVDSYSTWSVSFIETPKYEPRYLSASAFDRNPSTQPLLDCELIGWMLSVYVIMEVLRSYSPCFQTAKTLSTYLTLGLGLTLAVFRACVPNASM